MDLADFTKKDLPIYNSIEWDSMLNKSKEYEINLINGKIEIGKYNEKKKEKTILNIDAGFLETCNLGEWGGYIKYIDKNGKEYILKEGTPILGVFLIKGIIFFVENVISENRLYGIDCNIYVLNLEEKIYKLYLTLDENVTAFTTHKDDFYFATSSSLIHYSIITNYNLLEKKNIIFNKSIFGLYVNSIITFNKSIYLGLRGGIVKIEDKDIEFYKKN